MDEYIKHGDIKIKCNIPTNQILYFSMHETIGAHAYAEVVVSIETGSLNLSERQLNSEPVKICSSRSGKEFLLFSGVIGKIRIVKEAVYDILWISAYSISWLLDLERKNKSYQNCKEPIANMIKRIAEDNSFSVICGTDDETASGPFIQYMETDWQFLLRLSSHLHLPLMAAGSYDGKGIYLGFQENKELLDLKVSGERWRMDSHRSEKDNWGCREAAYYEVFTSQILHLGQNVRFRNEPLWIHEANMKLEKGVLQCSYYLAGKNHGKYPVTYNPYLKGISLTGTVLERKEETVKIHLDIDEEQDIGGAFLYPWLPEHGNMVYSMPEAEGRVRLLIPCEDERNAIGINCVRQNGQVCEETLNPDNRWFVANEKKMTLQPSTAELSAGDDCSRISIQDTGNIIRSGKEIVVQAIGKIIIQGTKIELKAPKEITAVKRQLGEPAVVNICHNLDVLGEYSKFKNLEELRVNVERKDTKSYQGRSVKAEKLEVEQIEKEKEKLKFKLKELTEQEEKTGSYELGPSMINIISAVPQIREQDRLSQIAMGFRPIIGRMGGQ